MIFLEAREIYRDHGKTGLLSGCSQAVWLGLAHGRSAVSILSDMKYFQQRQRARACKRKADIAQWTGR